MTGLLILLGLGLALAWAVVTGYVAWMLTHPPRRTYAAAVSRGRPGDPSELPGKPRPYESWSHSALAPPVWDIQGDEPAGPVIILTHGWADSRIGGLARVEALAPVASRLILWDLPGHGEAPGACALSLREVAQLGALIDSVSDTLAPGQSEIVLYGWSLGAGVSIASAAGRPGIAAVIAESPYRLPGTPARNVLRARGLPYRATLPPALVIVGALNGSPRFAGFDRAALAAQLSCPLLVLHGSEDAVSPIEDGRAIAAAASRAVLAEVPGAGHNDLWTSAAPRDAATLAVRDFLQSIRPTLTP